MARLNEIEELKTALRQAKLVQAELDRRVFHLRTLYDVSKDIFSSVEYDVILKNFLLMTMGNFGVGEGFILVLDSDSGACKGFSSMGFSVDDDSLFREKGRELLMTVDRDISGFFWDLTQFTMPFRIDKNTQGIIGLGEKLIGDRYNDDDKELIDTLINNLVVALKNAGSFQKIKFLNKNLKDKNDQLQTALNQLKQSMRKVEILESVKENLSKFVPMTVSRMIEKSPTNDIPESCQQDLSILFADIEGYTRLCEKLGSIQTADVIEKHFSGFMQAIYNNNGDVNETAGDGLMVLFLNEDKKVNAIEAVRAAVAIRLESIRIFEECSVLYRPLDINMGISSGKALVGAAKFDTYSGSRWTYTARGSLTNIAARIAAQATKGRIFLSKETRERVKDLYPLKYNGAFQLKNVSEKTDIYEVDPELKISGSP